MSSESQRFEAVAPREAPRFSIVVPVRNERESLDELMASIDRAVQPMPGRHEVIFVDDGSTDGTLEKLKDLARGRPELRVFSFRRNLGKANALECGFRYATGDYILTLDADLQDDPGNLSQMLEHLTRERVDVVSGWRRERRDSVLKVISSKLFNVVIVRMLFGATFNDMNSGLKLYRAEAAKELHLYGGMHRFIPLIAQELGYRVAEVPVRHHERKYGTSKYRATKILTEIPDLLTLFFLIRYTGKPLHFFGRIGSALLGLGGAVLVYLSVLWSMGHPIGTRPLLTFGVLLVLIGAQIVFTGLLADLMVNMNQSKAREFSLKYRSDAIDRNLRSQ
jgi:glycosyltransferase involved in cell wall biosynthesis